MYSKYDRSHTYNMYDDNGVIYGQAIRVQIIDMRMYNGANKKR
jgi:hypothetical protein